jgi:hypothetical protein
MHALSLFKVSSSSLLHNAPHHLLLHHQDHLGLAFAEITFTAASSSA